MRCSCRCYVFVLRLRCTVAAAGGHSSWDGTRRRCQLHRRALPNRGAVIGFLVDSLWYVRDNTAQPFVYAAPGCCGWAHNSVMRCRDAAASAQHPDECCAAVTRACAECQGPCRGDRENRTGQVRFQRTRMRTRSLT